MVADARFWTRDCLPGVTFMTGSYGKMRFSRHSHSTYAFGVVESGALGFRYLGESCVALPGQINLVVPGEVHDGYPAVERGWCYRMVYVDPLEVEKVSSEVWHRDRGLPFIPRGVVDAPDLAILFRRFHIGVEAGFLDDLSVWSLWLGFLVGLLDRFGEHRGACPVSTASMERVCRFMRENMVTNPSLDELAALSGLSRWHFLRVFKDAMGLPPHLYMVQMRIRRAEELLRLGRAPAEVASEVGFADQSHLTRWFKGLTGTTPGAYRRDFLRPSRSSSNFLQ